MRAYLDNGASTKVDPEVVKAMKLYFTEKYGNASSIHSFGRKGKEVLESSRKTIAEAINAKPEEIIFTSGGTESNNLALKGISFSSNKKHIITTKIEHDSVLETCKWLEKRGYKITYLEVDEQGFVDIKQLEKEINPDTLLVSIIHGSNEIGAIQDLESIGKICKQNKVLFHTDACQSFTKTELDVEKFNLDLVTLNAHKIHGPKGVGILYIKKGTKITPLSHGGGHEFNLRSGTENIPGIVGFAEAVKLAKEEHIKYMIKLRDKIINEVLKIPETRLNGPKNNRLCNNANFSFRKIEGESIIGSLDIKGIAASTGSACSSHSLEPSHVLLALGLSREEAHGSLRLTISRFTKEEEIDYLVKVLPGVVKKLRSMSPLED
jgi:cysteine desulfurase